MKLISKEAKYVEFETNVIYFCKHKPSGEEWTVLGINFSKNEICVAGYPPTIAKLSDCYYFERGSELTRQEKEHRTKHFGENWN